MRPHGLGRGLHVAGEVAVLAHEDVGHPLGHFGWDGLGRPVGRHRS